MLFRGNKVGNHRKKNIGLNYRPQDAPTRKGKVGKGRDISPLVSFILRNFTNNEFLRVCSAEVGNASYTSSNLYKH